MQSVVAKVALAFAGFLFSNLHLWTFDKLLPAPREAREINALALNPTHFVPH